MKTFFKSRFSVVDYKLFDFIVFALFIGLGIVFDRFLLISMPFSKIGIGFLPIAFIAYRYGATGAIIVAFLIDFIGATLLPTGVFNPALTATAAFEGLILGLFLYKNKSIVNNIISALLFNIVCTLLLRTYFLYMYFGISKGYSFIAVLLLRMPQFIFSLIAQIILFRYLYVIDLILNKTIHKKR